MKGEWYIVAAVLFSFSLLTLFNIFESYSRIDYTSILKNDEDLIFFNVIEQLNKTLENSKNVDNLNADVEDFLSLAKNNLIGAGYFFDYNLSSNGGINITYLELAGKNLKVKLGKSQYISPICNNNCDCEPGLGENSTNCPSDCACVNDTFNCCPDFCTNDTDVNCCLNAGYYWDPINNSCCGDGINDDWCNIGDGSCVSGIWFDDHCNDNIQNCNESGIDCGGVDCLPCEGVWSQTTEAEFNTDNLKDVEAVSGGSYGDGAVILNTLGKLVRSCGSDGTWEYLYSASFKGYVGEIFGAEFENISKIGVFIKKLSSNPSFDCTGRLVVELRSVNTDKYCSVFRNATSPGNTILKSAWINGSDLKEGWNYIDFSYNFIEGDTAKVDYDGVIPHDSCCSPGWDKVPAYTISFHYEPGINDNCRIILASSPCHDFFDCSCGFITKTVCFKRVYSNNGINWTIDTYRNCNWCCCEGDIYTRIYTSLSSGNIIANINPGSVTSWGILSFTKSEPAGTSLTVDVLDFANNVILSDVVSGTNLSAAGVNASTYPTIKLRANFNTTIETETPVLYNWNLTYKYS